MVANKIQKKSNHQIHQLSNYKSTTIKDEQDDPRSQKICILLFLQHNLLVATDERLLLLDHLWNYRGGGGTGGSPICPDLPQVPQPRPSSAQGLYQVNFPFSFHHFHFLIFVRILLNPYFERLTMTVIMINCVTLGMYQPCEDSGFCDRKCQILKVKSPYFEDKK